jgi:hypothetical protein
LRTRCRQLVISVAFESSQRTFTSSPSLTSSIPISLHSASSFFSMTTHLLPSTPSSRQRLSSSRESKNLSDRPERVVVLHVTFESQHAQLTLTSSFGQILSFLPSISPTVLPLLYHNTSTAVNPVSLRVRARVFCVTKEELK